MAPPVNIRLVATITGVIALFSVCGVILLIGATGQYMFREPEPQPKPVKIAQVPALPTATFVSQVVKSPSGLIAAAVDERRVPTDEPAPTATPTPTDTPTPFPYITATPRPTFTPIVVQPGVASRLLIPKINVNSPVRFAPIANGTWMVDHLGQSIGHLEGTAPPGADSNMVLAGHVTLSAGVLGPFAELSQLAPGDTIIVYEGAKEHLYVVDYLQTVARTSVEVVYPSESGEITLITCINWSNREGRYSNRLIVKGHLVSDTGSPLATPSCSDVTCQ
jgi:LPXTG-site transpeptidase (sortase) family protein